ncbi:MAG TPA: hypothetical protein VFH51_06715 [Myxococcota bacterium]|nr:hypothetical protein [Myxococcota bacterium]
MSVALPTARAQAVEAPPSTQLMSLRVGAAEGLFGIGARRGLQDLDLGFFGGDAADYFVSSAEAHRHAELFASRRKTGFALWASGLTVLVADMVAMTPRNGAFAREHSSAVVGGLLVGSALSVASLFVLNASNTHLADAVSSYNADLVDGRMMTP